MALAIEYIKCKVEVIIKGSESINKSYKDFWIHFKKLGGKIHQY